MFSNLKDFQRIIHILHVLFTRTVAFTTPFCISSSHARSGCTLHHVRAMLQTWHAPRPLNRIDMFTILQKLRLPNINTHLLVFMEARRILNKKRVTSLKASSKMVFQIRCIKKGFHQLLPGFVSIPLALSACPLIFKCSRETDNHQSNFLNAARRQKHEA